MTDPLLHTKDIAALTGFEFEKACRYYTQVVSLDEHLAICRVLTRYKLYIDRRDTSLAPHMMLDGFWETWLSQCLARIIEPGFVCLDIGANFGYFSLLMSSLAGDSGTTVAVEPNPHLARLLRMTASVNGPGFKVADVALADQEGTAGLYIPDEVMGDASLIERTDRSFSRQRKIDVKMITLDALLAQMKITRIDVIKMDVEGVEPLVFKGMSQTLQDNPDLRIILEYSPFLYEDARAFTEYLFAHFSVQRIKDVAEPTLLSEPDISSLLALQDHTDLYLQRKS